MLLGIKEPVAVLADGFPDQCHWIQRFSALSGARTVGELISFLGYDGPVELLTMHTCFSGAPQVKRVGSGWMLRHLDALRAAKAAYGQAWGHGPGPIPAVLIPLVEAVVS